MKEPEWNTEEIIEYLEEKYTDPLKEFEEEEIEKLATSWEDFKRVLDAAYREQNWIEKQETTAWIEEENSYSQAHDYVEKYYLLIEGGSNEWILRTEKNHKSE